MDKWPQNDIRDAIWESSRLYYLAGNHIIESDLESYADSITTLNGVVQIQIENENMYLLDENRLYFFELRSNSTPSIITFGKGGYLYKTGQEIYLLVNNLDSIKETYLYHLEKDSVIERDSMIDSHFTGTVPLDYKGVMLIAGYQSYLNSNMQKAAISYFKPSFDRTNRDLSIAISIDSSYWVTDTSPHMTYHTNHQVEYTIYITNESSIPVDLTSVFENNFFQSIYSRISTNT